MEYSLSFDAAHSTFLGVGRAASQVALVIKNLPANAGDQGSIPGMGRSPGEGNSYPLQGSFLANAMDREAWRATYSPWGSKESYKTEQLSTHTHTHTHTSVN